MPSARYLSTGIFVFILLSSLTSSASRDQNHLKARVKQVSREKFQGGSNDQYLLANTFDDDEIFVPPNELIEEKSNFPDDQASYSGDGNDDDESDDDDNEDASSKSNDKNYPTNLFRQVTSSSSTPSSQSLTTETNSVKNDLGCEIDQFECLSGQCIDSAARCDQHFDCKDGSDEISCGKCYNELLVIE